MMLRPLLLFLCAAAPLLTRAAAGVCSITGPQVIDLSGHLGSVPDRCSRLLLAAPGLRIIGSFRERRRSDLSFLDQVTLRLDPPGVELHLRQGGAAQVGNVSLSLASPQRVQGVLVSRTPSGLLAQVSLTNSSCSIFFDGTTAQISPQGELRPLQGLCVNSSSSMSLMKEPDLSPPSCEKQYTEQADENINCTVMTQRCSVLQGALFSACHSSVDPAPYVRSCSALMCRYPDQDQLTCDFLQSYARACSLTGHAPQEDWRSKVKGCSPPLVSCVNTSCSPHEFCGLDAAGRSVCVCRSLFASRFRATGALGEPTRCDGGSAQLSLAACLLEDRALDYSALHLNDPTCRGHLDQDTHLVTFSFNRSRPCGTAVTVSGDRIVFMNRVSSQNSSSGISRLSSVQIEFSCFYKQPEPEHFAFSIEGGEALQQVVSGSWNYSLSMSMCSDAACTQPLDLSDGVDPDQVIYIRLDTVDLDWNIITLLMESCYATNGPGGTQRYDLITDGCSNQGDNTVKVVSDGQGGTILSFQMFQFNGGGGVALHFKMKLCVTNSPGCEQTCSRRRRRSPSSGVPLFVTLTWP